MNEADRSFACASALVDALVRDGVSDACISPGSRSTAIALALNRHGAIRVRVHLDERSSAFFAVGLAKATDRPVIVATTSGTAAAEPFAAVIEASQSRVPLIVLTADRPPRLRGTGSNQTIDQTYLFSAYVRGFFQLPLPRESSEDAWEKIGSAANEAATSDPQGPVHLNIPFDEPLVPGSAPPTPDARQATPPSTSNRRKPPEAEIGSLVEEISGKKAVLVAGPSRRPADEWSEVAERLGWPVIAEPLSGLRRPGTALGAGQAILGSDRWLQRNMPSIVIQIGATPTTRRTQRLVGSAPRLVVIDDEHLEPDPEGRASLRINADAEEVAGALLERDIDRAPDTWIRDWAKADALARRTLDSIMDGWTEPFEPRIARDIAKVTPDGSTLFVGNSSPVRDLDLAMAPRDGLKILANRGASGIDGLVSTALGIAAAGSPTFSLIGDLSLLHDIGALAWGGRRPGHDITFVVVDNGGGALFAQLAQRDLPEFGELFATPHGANLQALATAAGVTCFPVEKAEDLEPALQASRLDRGIRLVVVSVDPELGLVRRRELDRAVDDALIGSIGEERELHPSEGRA